MNLATTPATILYGDQEARIPSWSVEDGDLWIPIQSLAAATGWELKPEGVCKGGLCVPVPDAGRSRLVRTEPEELFNLTEFARRTEQATVNDDAHRTWYFGPPGWEWKSRGEGRQAPDFTLPDLEGRIHSLSEELGKKVFLLFWASW